MNNLNNLHTKINTIIPIDGISPQGNNIFIIHYSNNQLPTEDQIEQINSIIDSWPLDEAKINKLTELDIYWENVISNGWTTPYGWKLGLTVNDVTLLTGLFVLAKELNSLGFNDPSQIMDIEGLSHPLHLQDLTTLMLQYGNARSQLSSKYANIKTLINNAVSLESVNNINISLLFDN